MISEVGLDIRERDSASNARTSPTGSSISFTLSTTFLFMPLFLFYFSYHLISCLFTRFTHVHMPCLLVIWAPLDLYADKEKTNCMIIHVAPFLIILAPQLDDFAFFSLFSCFHGQMTQKYARNRGMMIRCAKFEKRNIGGLYSRVIYLLSLRN